MMKSWEWKFVVPRAIADGFLEAIAPHVRDEVHDPARPVCYTRTTYLDTSDYAFLRSSGTERSRRIRVREYASATHLGGAAILAGDPWLELKESADNTRTKIRFRAPSLLIGELIASHGHVSVDRESMELDVLRAALRESRPLPRMTTWYRRESRASDDGRVRITLDAGLTFARPQALGERGAPAKPDQIVERFTSRILEVKYSGDPPAWLVEAVAILPRPRELSKFREGMLAIARVDRVESRAGSEAS